MELSKNLWHAKLYNITYNTTLPQNLCPYFWKVILGLIIFIPLAVIFTPLKILWLIKSIATNQSPNKISNDGFLGETLLIAIVLDIALFCGFNMVYMWFGNIFDDKVSVFEIFGILGYMLIIFGAIIVIEEKIKKRRKKNRKLKYSLPKKKYPNILKEFVKAKYNRYCPQIEWTNKAK